MLVESLGSGVPLPVALETPLVIVGLLLEVETAGEVEGFSVVEREVLSIPGMDLVAPCMI